MPAAGIADSGNLFGALDFATSLARAGIQPLIGCTVGIRQNRPSLSRNSVQAPPIVLFAQSEAGFRNLLQLVSGMYLEGTGQAEPERTAANGPALDLQRLETHSDGLICLTGGPRGAIGTHLLDGQDDAARLLLERLAGTFPDRLYVEIQRHGTGGAARTRAETRTEPALLDLAYALGLPLVATTEAYFPDAGFHPAHGILRGIAARDREEPHDVRYTPENRLRSAEDLRARFADLPEALDNTADIARRISFFPQERKPILPRFAEDETQLLRDEAKRGLERRLAVIEPAAEPEVYWKRLEFELDVIVDMDFAGYFLIVANFVNWAQERNIPVGPGRGSGAGSLVAYALRIVDLDPIRYGLLFERFLNPERISMPDFDIDFCEVRRDEVIEHVRERYGAEHVAKIVTFNTLQARAALHDTGRVLGMARGQTNRIANEIPYNPAKPMTLSQAWDTLEGFRTAIDEEENGRRLFDLAVRIEGLFRNTSIHPAGVVIGNRPLIEFVPLYRDPRGQDEVQSTQYDMVWAERAGLVKFDFLSSKIQTTIRAAIDLAAERGDRIELSEIPLDDRQTLELYCRAETAGLYQVEGEGMRSVLTQVQPDRFEDLIAVVALFRPGPMENIPDYCAVKHGEQEMKLLHPGLEPILRETYGIIVYQEQVMEIARALAGYSLGDADILRRAMGKKKPEEMKAQRTKFLAGLRERGGLNEKQASEIYELVLKFADYGFNKSHAAAYALVSYQTAWLKAHYPLEFYAASLDAEAESSDTARFDKISKLLEEARRRGIPLSPPDVNRSCARFRPVDDSLPYALGAVKGVGIEACKLIDDAREAEGPFRSVGDLARRADLGALGRKGIENLARVGAFDSLAANRRSVMLSAEDLIRYSKSFQKKELEDLPPSLFGDEEVEVFEPALVETEDFDPAQRFAEEREAAGLLISGHPIDAHRAELDRRQVCLASAVTVDSAPGTHKAAGMISSVTHHTSRRNMPYARITLSDPDGNATVLMFDRDLEASRAALKEQSLVRLDLEVVQRGNRDGMVLCRRVRPLDSPEPGATRREAVRDEGLRIRIECAEAAEGVRAALDRNGANGAGTRTQVRVALRIADIGAWAELELPGWFRLDDVTRNSLTKETGVIGLERFDPRTRERIRT